jgi:PKD repeat protein
VKIGAAVEDASEVMDKIEHALALLKEVASGSRDVSALSDEANTLFALLQRLNHNKRWEDALRVARCMATVAALIGRWLELLRSLRIALHAAEALGDPLGEAWALHELGTLELVAGRNTDANRQLEKAREIRSHFASRDVRVTNANLQVLCQTLRRDIPRRPVERALDRLARRPLLALLAAVALVAAGAGGDALAHHGSTGQGGFHRATVAFSFVPSTPHVGQSVVFSATATDARDPAASYTWQWGDGDPATERVQRHEYLAPGTFRVLLTVRDARRRVIGTITRSVSIRRPTIESGPNAYFTFLPRSPTAGKPVAFSASSSYDPRARIAGYEWSFGDGRSARGVSAFHSFANPRDYTVSLTVTDTDGKRDTLAQTVAVTEASGKPSANSGAPAEPTTQITCPSSPVEPGQAVSVKGSITPARAGASVTVTFSHAGQTITQTPTSNAEGLYETSFTTEVEGTWSIQSLQAQSDEYAGSQSEPCALSVERPPPAIN